MGVLSPAGSGVDALWNAVKSRETFVSTGLGSIREHEASPVRLALSAIREACAQAGWDSRKTLDNKRDGLILATTVGQISAWESKLLSCLKGDQAMESFASFAECQPIGSLLEQVAGILGFQGRMLLLASACSAGTQAIALGSLWVRSGTVRRCLVGGVEVLSELTVEGFRSLGLLSQRACRPFDRDRDGINLAEASAFLCLEADSPRALAQVTGEGFATDAYHLAAPQPEGLGSLTAMRQALSRANLEPEAITWVHAHGTGSIANDLAEGAALSTLFGQDPPPVASTKGVHGHALGASGVLEAIVCVKSIQEGLIPATTGLLHADPALALRLPVGNVPARVRHVLKNTLGFGGNNAAIVLSQCEAMR